jgi:hypothetical protein
MLVQVRPGQARLVHVKSGYERLGSLGKVSSD